MYSNIKVKLKNQSLLMISFDIYSKPEKYHNDEKYVFITCTCSLISN